MVARKVCIWAVALMLVVACAAVDSSSAWAKGKKKKKSGGGGGGYSQPHYQAPPTPPVNTADIQAHATMSQLNGQIRDAQQEVSDAKAAETKIEDDLIDGESPDTDFGKIRDAYLLAKAKYQDSLKSTADDDDTVAKKAAAKAAYLDAKDTYDKAKRKFLTKNQDWSNADDDLRQKQKNLDDLNRQFQVASGKSLEAGLHGH